MDLHLDRDPSVGDGDLAFVVFRGEERRQTAHRGGDVTGDHSGTEIAVGEEEQNRPENATEDDHATADELQRPGARGRPRLEFGVYLGVGTSALANVR